MIELISFCLHSNRRAKEEEKLKIVFPYSHSNHAFGSPAGWDLNVAELFRRRGHEVHFGDGNWGVEEGFKADILFVYERLDLWEDERSKKRWESFQQCADKILLGVFDPGNPAHLPPPPENCTLITPFRSLGTQCAVLPYAYYETTPVSKFQNKTIGWTIRNPFVDVGSGSFDPAQLIHLEHLKACNKLVQEGHRLVLFSNNTYYKFDTLAKAQHILDDLRNDAKVKVVDHMPYSDYLSLLKETSVVVPLNGIGSTTEALKLGSLPLAWNNVVNIYSSFPNTRNYYHLTYDDIYNKLHRLLTDEEFYEKEYNTLFSLAGIYTIDAALEMLDSVLERL